MGKHIRKSRRSQLAFDRVNNTNHDRLHYRLQSARYKSEIDIILNFVRGKDSHYYYEDRKIEKVA